jgi:hypothetical protein
VVGLQRIGGDHRVGQFQVGQQRPEPGTSPGAPSTWCWATTARVVWSIAASRWTCRPSGACLAPRGVLPSTATARRRLGLGLRPVSQAPMAAARASGSRRARVRRMVASAGTAQ